VSDLARMLDMQRRLQLSMPDPNKVPADLRGDERAAFLTWNAWALSDEVHEMMGETGWKPWATSRHLNVEQALKEMVDAWHFFMNILLVIGGEAGWTTEQLAAEFIDRYVAKNAVNAARQADGYDGVTSKCPRCRRELSEVPEDHATTCV